MYIARFSYDVQPVHRQQAIAFIEREVAGAKERGLAARLLIPLTRAGRADALGEALADSGWSSVLRVQRLL